MQSFVRFAFTEYIRLSWCRHIMDVSNHPASLRETFVFSFVIILAYAGAAIIAPLYFAAAGLETIFWPASGIATAAILLGKFRYLPAIVIAAVIAGIVHSRPWEIRLAFFMCAVAEAVLAWPLVKHVGKVDVKFESPRHYIRFIIFAGILLPLPCALIAAGAIKAFSVSTQPYWHHALVWWMGNSLGIILLVPIILIWRKLPKAWASKTRITELAALLILTLISGSVFVQGHVAFAGILPRAFVGFIFVTWSALRFGRHATLVVTFILVMEAIVAGHLSVRHGMGSQQPAEFANIWFFLVTLSTVGMALATTLNEKKSAVHDLTTALDAYRRAEMLRGQSNTKLEKSTIDFRRIVETAEEGIWLIDAQGITTFVNQRMADMLGYTREAMLGQNFINFMPDADRTLGAQRLASRNSGQRERHDSTLVHKDGHIILTHMSTNPIVEPDGSVSGALAMVTDVTDWKSAEKQLLESQELYQKIVEGISDAIIVHRSGIIVFANQSAHRILGARKGEKLAGRNGLAFTHPDDRPAAMERMQRLAEGGTQMVLPPFSQRIITLDDRTIKVETTTTTIVFNGSPALLVIGRPVSD
jgi:PAS domain S-box-containing protein